MYFTDIIGYNRAKQQNIYKKNKLNKITRIIITRYKYFAQINYYKHCSATAHLPPSSLASLQSWGHVGNVSWITLECIFSSRFVHKLFLFFAPGKKKDFFCLRKGLSWPKWSFPVFCVVCVVWSHRAALLACQLGAGINFAFYSFVGAKHLYMFLQKKGVYLMKQILFVFR